MAVVNEKRLAMLNRLASLALEERLNGARIPLDRIRDPRWIAANVATGRARAMADRILADVEAERKAA